LAGALLRIPLPLRELTALAGSQRGFWGRGWKKGGRRREKLEENKVNGGREDETEVGVENR